MVQRVKDQVSSLWAVLVTAVAQFRSLAWELLNALDVAKKEEKVFKNPKKLWRLKPVRMTFYWTL